MNQSVKIELIIARWSLRCIGTLCALGVCIQAIYLLLNKDCSAHIHIYMAMLAVTVCLSAVCYYLVSRNLALGLLLFAWASLATLTIMVTFDLGTQPIKYPGILFLPVFGVIALGLTLGQRQMRAYVCASIVLAMVSGVLYDRVDDAFIASIVICAGEIPSLAVNGLIYRYTELQAAIQAYAKAKS